MQDADKMRKKAVSLPINTLIILIIAVLVLILTVVFYSMATGREIFPSIIEKIKTALGLFKESSIK